MYFKAICECYWVHSDSYTSVRYLKSKSSKSSRLGRVQAFPMYGGLGMSAPSLHKESTDSLISRTRGWRGARHRSVEIQLPVQFSDSIGPFLAAIFAHCQVQH